MNSTPEIEPEDETTTGPMPQSDTAVQEEHAPSAEGVAAEVEKYKDAALRARADLDNYRKRVAREKEDAIRYANNSLLESLLPILDNFELGLEAAKNTPEASNWRTFFAITESRLLLRRGILLIPTCMTLLRTSRVRTSLRER